MGVHIDAAAEIRAFQNADGGRIDIAVDLGGLLHEDRFFGLQVPFHRALDGDELSTDIRLDGALHADREPLGVGDGALDSALDQQVLLGTQIAFEIERRSEDRGALGGAVVRVTHAGSPDRESAGETNRHNRNRSGTFVTKYPGAVPERARLSPFADAGLGRRVSGPVAACRGRPGRGPTPRPLAGRLLRGALSGAALSRGRVLGGAGQARGQLR